MPKRGRPFTYHSNDEKPVTISVRLPHELYDRVQRFAGLHRQSISELVKDGLEWRLTQDDPRVQTVEGLENYDNTVLREIEQRIVDHVMARLAVSNTVIQSNTATTPHGEEDFLSDRNETLLDELLKGATRAELDELLDDTIHPALDTVLASVESGRENMPTATPIPPYDATKFYLGTLCPKGHEFGETGQSLLSRRNHGCRACENARARERRQARKQVRA